MTDATETDIAPPKRGGKMLLILSLVLALAGGGGGFFALYSGLIFSTEEDPVEAASEDKPAEPLPDIGFVEITPIVISLPPGSSARHLRFSAHLEVPSEYQEDVSVLLPRIVDVLNGYLRALEPGDLEQPAVLFTIRAQMLRRIQIVTGEGRVHDLLVSEFVLT